MKIYTKTGDKGDTGLVGGERVSKSHVRLEVYGTIDELNSVIGFVRSLNPDKSVHEVLQVVQNDLFDLGSHFACADEKMLAKLPPIKQSSIDLMESAIDRMTLQLEPLKNFILPGGHGAAAQLHLARTVCRRAERAAVRLKETGELVDGLAIIYLNRLSDCLFVLARFVNHTQGIPDTIWKPN
jgi:cob(I)alamin adenosyltransferase